MNVKKLSIGMLHVLFPIYLLCNVFIGCFAENSSIIEVAQKQDSCEEIKGEEALTLVGAPFKILYSKRMSLRMFFKSKNLREGTNITCFVRDAASNEIMNSTEFPRLEYAFAIDEKLAYQIITVTTNTSLQYKIQCGHPPNSTVDEEQQDDHNCLFYNFNMKIMNGSAGNCTDTVLQTIDNSLHQGELVILACPAPDVFKSLPNVTYRWFKERDVECVSNFSNGSYIDEAHSLVIREVDMDDAGTYTCMAYHEHQKFALVRRNVCVQYRYLENKDFKLNCHSEKAQVNGNGTITCDVAVSITKSLPAHYSWYKIGKNREETLLCKDSSPTAERKVICSENSTIEKDKCYFTPAEDPPHDIRTITIIIENMEEDDFGEYRLLYRVNGIMPDGDLVANVSIEMDTKTRVTIHIAGITAGVLAVMLIIALIVFCIAIKMEILWFYKRHFGPYEKGNHPYMAYFLYYYQSGQQKGESNNNTKALVEHMHEFMDKFGGTVFDEQRSVPLEQYDANNVQTVLKECHRVVIFLSTDFLTDHWSRFATYTAMEAVIREGKKVILVTMPETKSSMNDIEDEARRVLKMAMKRNITIHWNGKVPFSNAFCRRLEYALPKHPHPHSKPDFKRYLSDSSQAQLTQHTGSPSKLMVEMKETIYDEIYENPSAV